MAGGRRRGTGSRWNRTGCKGMDSRYRNSIYWGILRAKSRGIPGYFLGQ